MVSSQVELRFPVFLIVIDTRKLDRQIIRPISAIKEVQDPFQEKIKDNDDKDDNKNDLFNKICGPLVTACPLPQEPLHSK